MRTFSIQTLGCKVNQYESQQIETLLRSRGLVACTESSPQQADLRIINTCSVTIQAASKSRQSVRRSTRLPVLDDSSFFVQTGSKSKVVVTGCWATSDREEALRLPGVDAVLGHHDNVAVELNRLLDRWLSESIPSPLYSGERVRVRGDYSNTRPSPQPSPPSTGERVRVGTQSLPLLDVRQSGHQRAMLKVQDGCDARCTYCIIPQLRSEVWSKPIGDVVDEAKRLIDAGHVEIVLTGIFLGAYGQPTALRRRQSPDARDLPRLIDALCTQIAGLRRLRFSSLEPGDLNRELLAVMRSHSQVVPHFHLPLQSGSDAILHKMNRQYTRDDFLRMIDDVNAAFDRPAVTTDIIVGFPGETDIEFEKTLDVVDRAKFIHIHGFSFSPRPGTAAARWTDEFVHGPVVNQRIDALAARGLSHSYEFRKQFIGEIVELLVEKPKDFDTLRHGRCERYFDVYFEDSQAQTGDAVRVTIDRVTPHRTLGRREP